MVVYTSKHQRSGRWEVSVEFVNLLVILALLATIVVLILGLRSMSRGGEYDKAHVEKFMWERIILQGIAVALLVVATILMNF